MARRAALVLAVFLAAPITGRAENCLLPWLVRQTPTLRDDAAESKFIVYVRPENNTKDGNQPDTTFLAIREVLKDHSSIAKRPVLRSPRFVAIKDPRDPPLLLVFGDVVEKRPDPYRGVPGGPALLDYFRGLLVVAPKGNVEVLRYCFDHLASTESAVAEDAFAEFTRASSADIARVLSKRDAAKLRRWLADKKMPESKLALFAFLLGQCGERRDTVLLRELIDREIKAGRVMSLDRFFIGCTLLDPAESWTLVRKLAAEGKNDLWLPYSALRAARFFHNDRPGVITQKELLSLLSSLLHQNDIADLAVEELRRWRCWDLTDGVLALADKKIGDETATKRMRRTILRYSLQCPDKRCQEMVAEARKKDAAEVKELEEFLKLEDPPGPKPK